MADMDKSETHKAHRVAHSGRKAKKKDAKKKKHHEQDLTARQRNPKAFAIQSVKKAERMFRRTMDIKSKGYKIPTVDRMPENPPPAVVAIVGPPKVGKTTLLKGLIRNFTKQKITSIQGPVTLVSGRKKRVTFIECNNDINNMIDIAKIADLVLLLIDAKSGFEMETFEFMNICQVHGMPRLMGVLTHLDLFKNKKAMQTQKKALKRRYLTEIPRAEKMFFLSGILHGEYLKKEMHNVGRFISVMKFELSSFKKSHPYVLVDRMEDITDPDLLAKNPVANRKVCLYGYARGGALKKNSPFHIPGCGDYIIKTIHFLPDPCPLPETLKKRSLNEKERLIYAPMSGVGGIVYDKDAVYIEVKDDQGQAKDELEDKPSEKLVSSIVSVQHPIDEKMRATKLQLLPGEQPLIEEDLSSSENDDDDDDENDEEEDDEDDDDENNESDRSSDNDSEDELSSDSESDSGNEESENESGILSDKEETQQKTGKKRKVRFEDEEDESHDFDIKKDSVKLASNAAKKQTKKKTKLEKNDDDNEDDFEEIGHAKWKDNLMKKAADDFYQRQKETFNLQKLVYGQRQVQETEDSDSDDEIGGLFRLAKHEKEKKHFQSDDGIDCCKFTTSVSRDWTDEKEMESIKDCFVTGKWDESEDAKHLLEEDDELYGDFEDYETGIAYKAEKPEKETSER
ncbi:Ribosome biogenesis protein BMS1-like protein, partial [Stegodyphus mimosarum]